MQWGARLGDVQPVRSARFRESLASFLGAFIGIACVGCMSDWLGGWEGLFLIGSFGATSVLVYGTPSSPLAQPRNVIGGHTLSAIIGVGVALLPVAPWMASALAVAVAIVVMQWTSTVHPPGGATALIATLGSPRIEELGFSYVVHPVGVGASMLVLVALVVNRGLDRRYPVHAAVASSDRRAAHR